VAERTAERALLGSVGGSAGISATEGVTSGTTEAVGCGVVHPDGDVSVGQLDHAAIEDTQAVGVLQEGLESLRGAGEGQLSDAGFRGLPLVRLALCGGFLSLALGDLCLELGIRDVVAHHPVVDQLFTGGPGAVVAVGDIAVGDVAANGSKPKEAHGDNSEDGGETGVTDGLSREGSGAFHGLE